VTVRELAFGVVRDAVERDAARCVAWEFYAAILNSS
jgi:hypothetical protein